MVLFDCFCCCRFIRCFLLWFRFRSFGRSVCRSLAVLPLLLLVLVFLAWSERAPRRIWLYSIYVYMGIKCAALAAQRLRDAKDIQAFTPTATHTHVKLHVEKLFLAFGYATPIKHRKRRTLTAWDFHSDNSKSTHPIGFVDCRSTFCFWAIDPVSPKRSRTSESKHIDSCPAAEDRNAPLYVGWKMIRPQPPNRRIRFIAAVLISRASCGTVRKTIDRNWNSRANICGVIHWFDKHRLNWLARRNVCVWYGHGRARIESNYTAIADGALCAPRTHELNISQNNKTSNAHRNQNMTTGLEPVALLYTYVVACHSSFFFRIMWWTP